MMSFSIRLNPEERKLADSYAKLHGVTLGEAFKDALFERIEDEFDLTIANDAYKEYLDSGKESRPISDFWEEENL